MKAIKFIIPALVVLLFAACSNAQTKSSSSKPSMEALMATATTTATLKVSGNCGECKARIEKAAKIDGVAMAEWSVDSKVLTVSFDSTKTNIDAIAKAIAAVGHDNEKFKADDKVYGALPGCCQYER